MASSLPPIPTVCRPMGRRHKLRKARGFSLGELKEAGLNQHQARSMGIRADERRSTVHAHNVAALKGVLSLPKTDTIPKAEHVSEEPEVKKEVVSEERKKVRRSRTARAKKRKT